MPGNKPTYHRMIAKLKAIGPYLREAECKPNLFLFDCLSVCVDDTKSPECREFWGWWMELEKQDEENICTARFHHGMYNASGAWVDEKLPAAAEAEVQRTQSVFQAKIQKQLTEQFALEFALHEDSEAIA
ncbi:sigma factor-binding protein Crl [Vibrio inusitatus NBRC 102082]|uniref:Sigma factor-binding protein Crl n=1 Tax=Vibrio inusitatus NBRC 102082 TaxID=1219070 RepID=A0A4Y3HSL4_9VIBR|nr:sigma factor-binding protein Crl [Vibrio inusitatus]GEA49314.1 sigma factor-binding protein Crl [Vibrio inusitatus NBRC 102082]